jgi:RNA recognition motif-containing protein
MTNQNHNNNHIGIDVGFGIDLCPSDSSLKCSKTNLIVNFLPQTFDCDKLKALFAPYGDIRSAKLVYDKLSGDSLCFGFVDYVHSQDAEKAISGLNGFKISTNKHLKVSFARPSSETIKDTNLYVCGLPKHWTVYDLNSYFGQCGTIITSRILTHENNKSKCVGFIRFDQRHESDRGMDLKSF